MAEAMKLANDGLDAGELRRAKNKMIGARKIGRQDLGGLAMTAGLDELYGLGFDSSDEDETRIEEVSAGIHSGSRPEISRSGTLRDCGDAPVALVFRAGGD